MAPPLDPAAERLTREDAGYHKALKNRQIQMIALGGAIGTGLFLGAGGGLRRPGRVCSSCTGSAAFSSSSSCARSANWCCTARRRDHSCPMPANSSARKGFRRRLDVLPELGDDGDRGHHRDRDVLPLLARVPGRPAVDLALIALVVVVAMNLISVKLFGELEFWAR